MRYIENYHKRREAQEDLKVKKNMIITLSDLYEKRYIFLKQTNMLNSPDRKHAIMNCDNIDILYENLLDIFKYDRRTLSTLTKIYPELYKNLKDKEIGQIAVVDMLANRLTNELDYKTIVDVLFKIS